MKILLRVFLTFALLCCGLHPLHGQGLPPMTKGAWTVAVVPDAQFYTGNDPDAHLFTQISPKQQLE